MARPYSNDLRERVVARVVAGEPVRAVATTFGVSVASVVKWSQRLRRTGSVAPDKMGFQRPKLLAPHRDWLLARMNDGSPFAVCGQNSLIGVSGWITARSGTSCTPRR